MTDFDFSALIAEKMRHINAHREAYIEAWYAKHGIPIENACLVQQELGGLTRVWIEVRHDFCQTHRAEVKMLRDRVRELEGELAMTELP